MPVDAAERNARRMVDGLRGTLDIPTVGDPSAIRAAALKAFTKQLDGKLANLQDGETLQITFRVDIIGANNTVRGGSGSERNMPEYIEWRTAVYERDNFTCRDCGAKGDMNAHHIKTWATDPHLRFDVENGITLCTSCHAKKHPHLRLTQHGKTNKARAKDGQASG